MIESINKGTGIRGALDYVFDKGHEPELLCGTVAGRNPRAIAKEMGMLRALRPTLGVACFHGSLSLPPGEVVSRQTLASIATDYAEGMGFGPGAWVAVQHRDTNRQHIHIVACRVLPDASVVSDKWDYRRGEQIVRQLEPRYGLTQIQPSSDCERHAPSEAEMETGRSDRLQLQRILDEAGKDKPGMSEFVERLRAAGVRFQANLQSTGRVAGISFALHDGGPWFKGSSLGKRYSFIGLQQKMGVSYVEERDLAALSRASERAGRQPSPDAERDPSARGRDRTEPGHTLERVQVGPGGKPENPRREHEGTALHDQSGQLPDEARRTDTDVLELPDRRDDWVRTRSALDDLAAPLSPLLKPEQVQKLRAWQRQHAALAAQHYRLTLKGRREGLRTYVMRSRREDGLWTAQEIAGLIARLRRENAMGYDVYLTPIDTRYHYLVVDDLTTARLAELRQTGYRPALIQQSSEDSFQAIIKILKLNHPHEHEAANGLVARLNREFGDPKFSGATHAFRLAGFANKKAQRHSELTVIIESSAQACSKATRKMEAARQALEQKERQREAETERARRLAVIEQASAGGHGDTWTQAFARHLGLARAMVKAGKWREIDYSVLDYRTVRELLAAGYDREQIAGWMKARSPELAGRHANQDDYIRRTLKHAAQRLTPAEREQMEQAPARRTVEQGEELEPDDDGMGFTHS